MPVTCPVLAVHAARMVGQSVSFSFMVNSIRSSGEASSQVVGIPRGAAILPGLAGTRLRALEGVTAALTLSWPSHISV